MTAGAIRRAKLQSNRRHQQTDTQCFAGLMSPNQQCQSTEGKISHSKDLLILSSSRGLPTLSLTTKGSWLPWGRFAMPLISPLMPVPQPLSFLPEKKRTGAIRGTRGEFPPNLTFTQASHSGFTGLNGHKDRQYQSIICFPTGKTIQNQRSLS